MLNNTSDDVRTALETVFDDEQTHDCARIIFKTDAEQFTVEALNRNGETSIDYNVTGFSEEIDRQDVIDAVSLPVEDTGTKFVVFGSSAADADGALMAIEEIATVFGADRHDVTAAKTFEAGYPTLRENWEATKRSLKTMVRNHADSSAWRNKLKLFVIAVLATTIVGSVTLSQTLWKSAGAQDLIIGGLLGGVVFAPVTLVVVELLERWRLSRHRAWLLYGLIIHISIGTYGAFSFYTVFGIGDSASILLFYLLVLTTSQYAIALSALVSVGPFIGDVVYRYASTIEK